MTSFPRFEKLFGALVSPISAVPVLILVLVWLIPYLLRRKALPVETRPLIIFILVAIAVSAIALFIPIPGFKGKTVIGQELRALVTLGIGLAFYLLFAAWPADSQRLRKTLQWINVGGVLLVTWTLVQAYYMFVKDFHFPNWILSVQNWLVVRSPYFSGGGQRALGLAYEPSWLAHQMVILYLPLWIAATYQKTSSFSFRIFRISLENILLVLGFLIFYLSSPRIGLISLLLMAIFLFAKVNLALYRRLTRTFRSRRLASGQNSTGHFNTIIGLATSLTLLLIYAAIAVGLFYVGSKRDARLRPLISKPPDLQEIGGLLTLDETTLLKVGQQLQFLERVSYWVTGWNIFNQYPLSGVGLGNAGFFFPQQMPLVAWSTFEIRNSMYQLAPLPNIKSLWVRLLAETGLAGFSIFLAWFFILWRSTRLTYYSDQPMLKMLALAGQLSILAFIGEGFSIDSFAMPYLWVSAGLISAAGFTYRRALNKCNPMRKEPE